MKQLANGVIAPAEALSSFIDGELDLPACRELWQQVDAEQALATLERYQLIREAFSGGLPDKPRSLRKVVQQAIANEPLPAHSSGIMPVASCHSMAAMKRIAVCSLIFILGGLFTWLLMLMLGA
jgi:negative regulator of sigma E activity